MEYENRFSLIYGSLEKQKHKSVFIENYINIQQGQNHMQNTYNKKRYIHKKSKNIHKTVIGKGGIYVSINI